MTERPWMTEGPPDRALEKLARHANAGGEPTDLEATPVDVGSARTTASAMIQCPSCETNGSIDSFAAPPGNDDPFYCPLCKAFFGKVLRGG